MNPIAAAVGKKLLVKNSLEQFRIKKFESSDEDSEEDEDGVNRRYDEFAVTESYGTMFPLNADIPDVVISEDFNRDRIHMRNPSQDFRLAEIMHDDIQDKEHDFSKSLVEHVLQHKRTLLQMNGGYQ